MENIAITFVFLALCVSVCMAQNVTAKPEPYEQEGFSFFYEHNTKTMLVKQGVHNCYIWTLTNDEIAMIHTGNGMRQVEVRVIKEIDSAVYTVINENIINNAITRYCTFNGKYRILRYFVVH